MFGAGSGEPLVEFFDFLEAFRFGMFNSRADSGVVGNVGFDAARIDD